MNYLRKTSDTPVFFGYRSNLFRNDRKKLGQFGHNVRKHRLANTVAASFNTITGKTTEMYRGKTVICRI